MGRVWETLTQDLEGDHERWTIGITKFLKKKELAGIDRSKWKKITFSNKLEEDLGKSSIHRRFIGYLTMSKELLLSLLISSELKFQFTLSTVSFASSSPLRICHDEKNLR